MSINEKVRKELIEINIYIHHKIFRLKEHIKKNNFFFIYCIVVIIVIGILNNNYKGATIFIILVFIILSLLENYKKEKGEAIHWYRERKGYKIRR